MASTIANLIANSITSTVENTMNSTMANSITSTVESIIKEPSFIEETYRKGGYMPRDNHTVRLKNCMSRLNRHNNHDGEYIISYDRFIKTSQNNVYLCVSTMLDNIKIHKSDANHESDKKRFNRCLHRHDTISKFLEVIMRSDVEKVFRRISHYKQRIDNEEFRLQCKLPIVSSNYVMQVSDTDTDTNTAEQKLKKRITHAIINGKVYDRNILYYKNGMHFSPMPKIIYVDFKKLNITPLKGAIRINWVDPKKTKGVSFNSIYRGYMHHEHGQNMHKRIKYDTDHNNEKSGNVPKVDNVKYFTVTFANDVKITHISTMGKPYLVYRYPHTSTSYDYNNLPYDDLNRINYTLDREKNYVTLYQVYAKKSDDKEWKDLGNFHGNTDRNNEVLHKFDEPVVAKILRIVPKAYIGSPSMQIALYGDTTMPAQEYEHKTVDCNILVVPKKKSVCDTVPRWPEKRWLRNNDHFDARTLYTVGSKRKKFRSLTTEYKNNYNCEYDCEYD